MYITVRTLKKTLGKFVELNDLYIGVPMLFIFLIMFSFTNFKIQSLIFLAICLFLMIPINLSKKNRMYKIIILLFKYLFRCREYCYFEKESNSIEPLKKFKGFLEIWK